MVPELSEGRRTAPRPGGLEVGFDDLRALDGDEFARLLLEEGQLYEREGLKAGPELTLQAPSAARDAAHEPRLLRHAEDDLVRVGQLIRLQDDGLSFDYTHEPCSSPYGRVYQGTQ